MKDILSKTLLIKRNCKLSDPTNIYEFIWKTFCISSNKIDRQIDPLLFIIKHDSIEIINFKQFLKFDLYNYFFTNLIGKRVRNELAIEGIATCIEMFVTELPIAETYQSIDEFFTSNPDAKSIVTLSLEWRGVAKIFTRSARKVKINNEYQFVEIEECRQVRSIFERFFDWTAAEVAAERNSQ